MIDTNSDAEQLSGVIENFDTNENNNVLQEDLLLENDLDKEILKDEPEILPNNNKLK